MNYHPGNVMFQNIIESYIHQYSIDPKASQALQIAIEMDVIERIQENGGRFLKWDTEKGWWNNMSIDNMNEDMTGTDIGQATRRIEANTEIQSKVHFAFRDFKRKMMKPQQNRQVVNSNTNNPTFNLYAFKRLDRQKRKRFNTHNNNNNNITNAVDSGISNRINLIIINKYT